MTISPQKEVSPHDTVAKHLLPSRILRVELVSRSSGALARPQGRNLMPPYIPAGPRHLARHQRPAGHRSPSNVAATPQHSQISSVGRFLLPTRAALSLLEGGIGAGVRRDREPTLV